MFTIPIRLAVLRTPVEAFHIDYIIYIQPDRVFQHKSNISYLLP